MKIKGKSICIDCKKELNHYNRNVKRCKACSLKLQVGIENPNYRHGKACFDKKYFCLDCGKELSDYRSVRCISCSKTGELAPQFGKRGIETSNYKHGKTHDNKCIDCGSHIVLYKAQRCHTCASTYLHEVGILNSKGENNGNFVDGRSRFPYPLEFNELLKAKIIARDNHKCQHCNMTEEEHKILYNKRLTIHHIDYNKENLAENNLITLCMKCNSEANSNREYWEKYYSEVING